MVDVTQFFDLQQILVNEVIGSVVLALFIGWIVILIICTRYSVPGKASVLIGMLWSLILFGAYYDVVGLIIVLAIIVVAMAFYTYVLKKIKSGGA